MLSSVIYSILIHFMPCREYCPAVVSHLSSIGFDLSIIVARWFIPLFSDVPIDDSSNG